MSKQEAHRVNALRAFRPGDPANAVFPVAAFWVEPEVGLPSAANPGGVRSVTSLAEGPLR